MTITKPLITVNIRDRKKTKRHIALGFTPLHILGLTPLLLTLSLAGFPFMRHAWGADGKLFYTVGQ